MSGTAERGHSSSTFPLPSVGSFIVPSATTLHINLILWSQDRLLLRQFLNTHLFQIPAPVLYVRSKECIERWFAKLFACQTKHGSVGTSGWSLVINACLPIDLDLANYEARLYVYSLLFSDSSMPRSLILYADLDGGSPSSLAGSSELQKPQSSCT